MKALKSNFFLQKIVIMGLGLLGGSICKRIKELDPSIFIVACGRKKEKIRPALDEKVVDEIITYNDLLPDDADLYIVAVPVEKSINIIQNILDRKLLKRNALIIDVGSVKQEIVDTIVPHEKGDRFIGCHPMTGSEKSSYNFSSAHLYENASVIITPHAKNNISDIGKITSFWELLGAYCITVDAKLHDEIVSFTSHLPHMISAALVIAVAQHKQQHSSGNFLHSFVGGGLRSMSRIAEGSAELWTEITSMNTLNIYNALEIYITTLQDFQEKVKKADTIKIKEFLLKAVAIKKELCL